MPNTVGKEDNVKDGKQNIQKETPQPSGNDSAPKNAVQRLYDKIPLNYKQVDIIVKVLIAVLAAVLIIGIATGSGVNG